jgi:hypothetical protein
MQTVTGYGGARHGCAPKGGPAVVGANKPFRAALPDAWQVARERSARRKVAGTRYVTGHPALCASLPGLAQQVRILGDQRLLQTKAGDEIRTRNIQLGRLTLYR